jgi:uncharacterized protein (UPF0332 family)
LSEEEEIEILIGRAKRRLDAASHFEKYYGKALQIAEELREEADYSTSREITEEEAKSVITDADAFVKRIEAAVEEIT